MLGPVVKFYQEPSLSLSPDKFKSGSRSSLTNFI